MSILSWAKKNIVTWSAIIAVAAFLFGPLIQEQVTRLVSEKIYGENVVEIFVCTPLRNATLLVSSTDGEKRKTHSAGYFPFLQKAQVIVVNNSDSPVPDSSLFIAPLNIASNSLMSANFYSDNNTSKDDYKVDELDDNAFLLNLGTFAREQVLVLEFLTLMPTSFVVEFAGRTESEKRVVNAGSCDTKWVPEKVSLPVDFYERSEFSVADDENLFGKIEDIVAPIGPVSFEVILDYDCGLGMERQIVSMGGPVQYCNINLNMPPQQ